jgi:hypothetical protein
MDGGGGDGDDKYVASPTSAVEGDGHMEVHISVY